MIAKSFRIPKNDIKFILKKGDTIHSVFFIIKKKDTQLPHPRIAIIASKKLTKKATERNKIRRRIHEAFRIILKENTSHPKKDFIFIAKKGILNKDFWDIKKDLLKLFEHEQN